MKDVNSPMKVAVIKLGARIAFGMGTSGAAGEAMSIIKILETAGCEVHIYTKILKKDDLIAPFIWHDISGMQRPQINGLGIDALLVINGSVNFFGGAEDREQIMNYVIINDFCGPVFYAYCDPALTLKQLWPSIEKKPWADKWDKDDIEILREDIVYISQPHDVEKIPDLLGKNCVIPKRIVHFPFEQFPCLNARMGFNPSPSVDLSYGGTMRGAKRIDKMVKFYFGHDIRLNVEMFGKIGAEDFTEHPRWKEGVQTLQFPLFTGPVKYADMLSKMHDSMAHVVIGDPLYERINDIPQRLYESIWAGVVTFIDSDLDKLRRVYAADESLADFLYVESRDELAGKLRLLKNEPEMRRHIVDAQYAAVNFNPVNYANQLLEIMKHG